jgi:hypothetical protein
MQHTTPNHAVRRSPLRRRHLARDRREVARQHVLPRREAVLAPGSTARIGPRLAELAAPIAWSWALDPSPAACPAPLRRSRPRPTTSTTQQDESARHRPCPWPKRSRIQPVKRQSGPARTPTAALGPTCASSRRDTPRRTRRSIHADGRNSPIGPCLLDSKPGVRTRSADNAGVAAVAVHVGPGRTELVAAVAGPRRPALHRQRRQRRGGRTGRCPGRGRRARRDPSGPRRCG